MEWVYVSCMDNNLFTYLVTKVINKVVTIGFYVRNDRGGYKRDRRRLESGHLGQWEGYLLPEEDNPPDILSVLSSEGTPDRVTPGIPKSFHVIQTTKGYYQ